MKAIIEMFSWFILTLSLLLIIRCGIINVIDKAKDLARQEIVEMVRPECLIDGSVYPPPPQRTPA